VILSRKQYKIETLLQWKTICNKKSYVHYGMEPLPMNLGDVVDYFG